ncbi:MAG: hypothetical protein GY862_38160, partial [Gammaproteobacteria bacterium]|nr:hypothetical protein [Gammaproteobacteria bacterium]
DSSITAQAQGLKRAHDGGNVTARNNGFFIMDKGLVLASAKGGDGGDIDIRSAQFVRSGESILDASSELGVDGAVQVNSPDVNMENVLMPPARLLDTRELLKDHCRVRDREKSFSRFVIKHYGGTSSAVPEDWLNSVSSGAFFGADLKTALPAEQIAACEKATEPGGKSRYATHLAFLEAE